MTGGQRVAVVGGGAVGVTAAHDLAEHGVRVTLYERGDVGSGSTGRAAGICYDAFAGERDAAVAARALERFRNLAAGTRFQFTDHPYVWLARAGDDRNAAAIEAQVPRMREQGRDVATLDPAGLREQFPALRADDVAVAAVARDAGYTDPGTYAAVMAERAREAGAIVRTDTEVDLDRDGTVHTPTDSRTFDAVVVAAGAHTKRLLGSAGVAIPLKPYRVQALVTGRTPASRRVPTWYDATAGVYARPSDGGVLAGDGTEPREFDPDRWDREADAAFVADTLESVRGALADAVEAPSEARRAWAGLCTATPDRDPLVGPVTDDLFVATGWHGHGFMRAPALGETVARQVRGEEGITAFDPRRFDGDEQFEVKEGMTVE